MKKKSTTKSVLAVTVLSAFLIFFTSCEVHFGETRFDVPWWYIAFPVALILLFVWYFEGKYLAKKKFVCEMCEKSFSPKWWKATFSVHVNEKHVFKCPHCGSKGFCAVLREKKGGTEQ